MLHFHNIGIMINDDEKNILGIYCLFSGAMEVLRHQVLVVNYFWALNGSCCSGKINLVFYVFRIHKLMSNHEIISHSFINNSNIFILYSKISKILPVSHSVKIS